MLTDADCRNASCPTGKKHKRYYDGNGLYLEVGQTGSKRWFWKTYSNRKEGRMALGSYPTISLGAARRARDSARLQKSSGINPVQARKLEKLKANLSSDSTFKSQAADWLKLNEQHWSESHTTRTRRNLEKDLFPYIGARPMLEITAMEVLQAILKVEERGSLEAANRVLGTASQVFKHWLPIAPPQYRNITEGLKARLSPRVKGHFPAIINPDRFGELIRAMRSYKGGPTVKTALQLAPILYQRPFNLRAMEWVELDLDGALWTIPSVKMKGSKDEKENRPPHTVPLPTQAVKLLSALRPLTGSGKYVFPSERSNDRPMSCLTTITVAG